MYKYYLQEQIAKEIEEKNKLRKEEEKKKLKADKQQEKVYEEISIEELDRINLKVAKVLEAEEVEGSDKLLKLKVSLGNEERQIVAGLKKYYKPEELVNKKLVIVANLKPAKLKEIESQGMILAAGDGDIVKALVVDDAVPEGENIH